MSRQRKGAPSGDAKVEWDVPEVQDVVNDDDDEEEEERRKREAAEEEVFYSPSSVPIDEGLDDIKEAAENMEDEETVDETGDVSGVDEDVSDLPVRVDCLMTADVYLEIYSVQVLDAQNQGFVGHSLTQIWTLF